MTAFQELLRRWDAGLLYAALNLADRLGSVGRGNSPTQKAFKPGISIVIPERSNPGLLSECLESVRVARRQLDEPSEVIVVVNGSPPSSYRRLMDSDASVRWLFSTEPLWFAGAVQKGLEAVEYDWVYLLNNDMVLEADTLCALLEWRSPQVFAIASQIYFRDVHRRREETGWTMFHETGGPIEILDEIPDDETTVRGTFYAGGGASLFRRHLLQYVSHDSSIYVPFYWEDVEWGTRAWRLGFECLFCPASKVRHWHRGTNGKLFSEAEIERILNRNRVIYHLRNDLAPGPFSRLLRTLVELDGRSQAEILAPRRLAQVVRGRLRNARLPFRDIPLDQTWRKCYGHTARTPAGEAHMKK